MSRFEVHYHDSKIPGMTFMVVVTAVAPSYAMGQLKRYGHKPFRTVKLGGK